MCLAIRSCDDDSRLSCGDDMMTILADIYISPIDQIVGALVASRFGFPFVFMEAVALAYVEQFFFRDVVQNRSSRIAMTLRANGIAATICSAFGVEMLENLSRIISHWIPRSFEVGFRYLFITAILVIPVVIETVYWKRQSPRTLFRRVLTANLVIGVCGVAAVGTVRWLRGHLPHWLAWKLRHFNWDCSWYMNPIGWFCLAVLVVAWIWRLPPESGQMVDRTEVIDSVNQAVEDTKC